MTRHIQCDSLTHASAAVNSDPPPTDRQVNVHSAVFLLVLTVGFGLTILGYFVLSEHSPVEGVIVYYVSRILFGFYVHGVLFCMPILFSLEMHLVSRGFFQNFASQNSPPPDVHVHVLIRPRPPTYHLSLSAGFVLSR